MAIEKLPTRKQPVAVRAAWDDEDGKQKIQKPADPAEPTKPAKPAEPTEPSEPAEPSKPSTPAKAANMFDEFIVQQVEDADDGSLERAMIGLVRAYLVLVPGPTLAQISYLATSIGVSPDDLAPVVLHEKSKQGNEESFNSLNEPGTPANSFDNDILNPVGETDLDPIEKPVSPMFSSVSKRSAAPEVAATADEHVSVEDAEEEDDNFLMPMSSMEDPVYAYQPTVSSAAKKVESDSTPRNTRTGIDDGAPVVNGDDSEQDALINDGVVDQSAEITEVNNHSLNDDGLS